MEDDRPFMTTAWTHLAMLNFEVDPRILERYLPAGTELDSYEGRTFVSVVGFRFQRTRVLGWSLPGHRNFAEINLRFYVRRRVADSWRRGVVFLKEIVALPLVAWTAKAFYDENFVVLPVRYAVESDDNGPNRIRGARYQWQFRGQWQGLTLRTQAAPQPTVEGSEEQFIAEHYWGYTRRRDGGTSEYRVEHPPWRVWQVSEVKYECDVGRLYGDAFVEPLAAAPSSAFLAEGSDVVVFRGRRLSAKVEPPKMAAV